MIVLSKREKETLREISLWSCVYFSKITWELMIPYIKIKIKKTSILQLWRQTLHIEHYE